MRAWSCVVLAFPRVTTHAWPGKRLKPPPMPSRAPNPPRSRSPIANRDVNFQGYGKFETASSGEYLFRTVKPGLYPGRTRHVHMIVELDVKQAYDDPTTLLLRDHLLRIYDRLQAHDRVPSFASSVSAERRRAISIA